MIPQAGTDLSKAIAAARAILERSSGQKSIILLSDGEALAGKPGEAAADAAAAGIRIFLIGTGTPEGEPIPIQDAEGRLLGYKKGPNGQTVVSKLNETAMMEIAAASGGAYYRATQGEEEVGEILKQIGSGPAGSSSSKGTSTRMRNRYRIPLLAAVLLLLLELFPMERPLSRPSPPPAALAAAALLLVAWSPKKDAKLWKGNKAYHKESYEEAFNQYARALKKGDKDPKPLFNSGDALYKMGDYDRAAESFKRLSDPRFTSLETAAAANYNLGNSLAKKGQGGEAAEAYRRCLLLDMKDEACRHNLALTLLKPPQQDKKQDEKKQDKKDKGGGGGEDKKPSPSKQQSSQKKQEQKSGMTKEDAERILQAIKERERQGKPMPVQPKGDKQDEKPGEDW
jgi:Ca-activated chloride channel family protein